MESPMVTPVPVATDKFFAEPCEACLSYFHNSLNARIPIEWIST